MTGLTEAQRIWDAVLAAEARGQQALLAEIVAVVGSAYRRPGALMMMASDGRMEGTVSGGCLEGDLFVRAEPLFSEAAPFVVDYDLAEDEMWSLGIGCKGHIRVWVRRAPEEGDRARWTRALATGGVLYAQLPLGADQVWLAGEDPPEGPLGEAVRAAWDGAEPRVVEPGSWFVRAWRPAPRLVLVGAGHDAEPVAQLAQRMGFRVVVVDPREAFNDERRFPGAEHVVVEARTLSAQQYPELVDAYWVVMNHHKERDGAALRAALQMRPRFVGALGPWLRTAELLEGVPGIDEVHGPLGLDLGAETPEEVALAIVAELMAVDRRRSGATLNRRDRVHAAR